jgi:uncharacterized protein YndB with AHSA1/START domain
MVTFTIERTIAAPPDVVFDILTDHRRYAAFTPLRGSELEREGDPAPNGVGAIRVLRAVGPPMREEVTAFERPHHFAYRMLSGAPLRDHVGDVTLEPAVGGTRVVYRIDSTPTVPVVGHAMLGVLRVAVSRLLAGVDREAERRGKTAAG